MTTPAGTISMSDVNIELGRSSTTAVNMNDTAVRALARKTSGTISMNDLRSKKFIDFTGFTLIATGISGFGETATADFTINSDSNWYGTEYAGFGQTTIYSGNWIPTNEISVVDDYEIRVQKTSGGTVSGTLNTWLNLADGPYSWSVTSSYPNSDAVTLQVDFRNAATTNIVETATVGLEASF
jgi:hypothetical protein